MYTGYFTRLSPLMLIAIFCNNMGIFGGDRFMVSYSGILGVCFNSASFIFKSEIRGQPDLFTKCCLGVIIKTEHWTVLVFRLSGSLYFE